MSSRYVIHEKKIDANCKALRKAYEGLNFTPSYSVKTNYVPMIVKRFYENGFKIECVSDYEVDIANRCGVSLADVIYNGPMKGEWAVEVARAGGIISFDSMDDMRANPLPRGSRVMFRVAVNIDNGIDTRFGIRPDCLEDAVTNALARGYNVVGIHCHVTAGRDLKSWQQKIDGMADAYMRVSKLLSEKIVDFGGNMYSPIEDGKKFDDNHATYEEYAELFRKNIMKFPRAKIYLESGTSVVANVMDFEAEVIGIKHTGKNDYVLLDCTKYHLGWATDHHNYEIEVIPSTGAKECVEDADFVGRLCTENDVIYRRFTGRIGTGDVIVFKNCGAYTVVVKPPFIMGHSIVLYERRDGKLLVAKCKETVDEMMITYEF